MANHSQLVGKQFVRAAPPGYKLFPHLERPELLTAVCLSAKTRLSLVLGGGRWLGLCRIPWKRLYQGVPLTTWRPRPHPQSCSGCGGVAQGQEERKSDERDWRVTRPARQPRSPSQRCRRIQNEETEKESGHQGLPPSSGNRRPLSQGRSFSGSFLLPCTSRSPHGIYTGTDHGYRCARPRAFVLTEAVKGYNPPEKDDAVSA